MSLSRIMLSFMMMICSIFAVNAMAADASSAQQGQPAAAATSASASAASDQAANRSAHHRAKVDINSASQATLAKILGAKKAQAIIDYRNKNGSFQSLNDLKNITNKKGKPMFSDRSIKRLANRLDVAAAAGGANATAAAQGTTSQQ